MYGGIFNDNDDLTKLYTKIIHNRFGGKSSIDSSSDEEDNKTNHKVKQSQPKSLSELLDRISSDTKVSKSNDNIKINKRNLVEDITGRNDLLDNTEIVDLNDLFKKQKNDKLSDETKEKSIDEKLDDIIEKEPEIDDINKNILADEYNPDGIFNVIDIPDTTLNNSVIYDNNINDSNMLIQQTKPSKLNKLKNNIKNRVNTLGGYEINKQVDSSPDSLEYTKDKQRNDILKIDDDLDKEYIKFVNEQKHSNIETIGLPENTNFNYIQSNNILKNDTIKDIDKETIINSDEYSLFNDNDKKLEIETKNSLDKDIENLSGDLLFK